MFHARKGIIYAAAGLPMAWTSQQVGGNGDVSNRSVTVGTPLALAANQHLPMFLLSAVHCRREGCSGQKIQSGS